MTSESAGNGAGIFTSPESFDGYYARAAERLRGRWESRVTFVSASIEKLQGLLAMAEVVEDEELAADLQAKLTQARVVLAELKAVPVPQG